MSNSHVGPTSVVGLTIADATLLEARTFCVVCGRFGSDFVLRKSGLKCNGCVGKMANKHWVRLQHRQANELLSQVAARARLSYNNSSASSMADAGRWAYSSVMDSEELGSSPPDQSVTHDSGSGEIRVAPMPPTLPRRMSSVSQLDSAQSTLDSRQRPQIMEYITNTTCYQAAAVGVRVSDVPSSASNAATLSTPDTNDDAGLNETTNLLKSPLEVPQMKRRKAPAVPPKVRVRDSLPSTEEKKNSSPLPPQQQQQQEQSQIKMQQQQEEEEEEEKVKREVDDRGTREGMVKEEMKPSRAVAEDDDNQVPTISTTKPVQLSARRKIHAHHCETVVRAVDAADVTTSMDGDGGALCAMEASMRLPPLLQQSDPYCQFPKTPRADDFMGLPDASSSDIVNREGSPEQPKGHVSIVPASVSAEVKRDRTSTHRTGGAQHSLTASTVSPGLNSLHSSMETGKIPVPPMFALSKTASDSSAVRSSRVRSSRVRSSRVHTSRVRTVSPATGSGTSKLQHRHQHHHHHHQQKEQHVDPASRQFERCNAKSGEPAISSSSSYSSASSAYLNANTATTEQQQQQQQQHSSKLTSRCRACNSSEDIKAPLSINIDRLYVAVEVARVVSPEGSPVRSAVRRLSSSSSSNTSSTHLGGVPVPSAPGSKFTVTRHFSSMHQRQESSGTLITPRRGLDQRMGTAGSADTVPHRTGGRRRRGSSPEGIEAKNLAFVLFVRDRDTKADLYSLKRRYFVDMTPTFQELKSLMSTLPSLPVRRIPSVRYVTDSFVAERRAECQTFLDAVVQNHFLIRHPRMVELLRLEPYLELPSVSQMRVHGGDMHSREHRRSASARGTHEKSGAMPSHLNEDALKRLGSMSTMGRFEREMSSSSCLSTTSSVARRSVMDGVGKEDLEKVQLGNLIGRGTFGAVYLGLLSGSSTMVAVKVIQVSENLDDEFLLSMRKELDVLRAARHQNIIRFLGSTYLEHERQLRVFTEFVECGNISTMVKKFGALPLLVIQKYMTQILRGLEYLHNMAIVHRDIKGENILITKKGRCKLADFGCSGTLHELEGREEMQGSPLWMAPEIIHGASPATAGDIWAVGCVGIEMLQRPIWNIDGDLNPYIFLYRVGKLNGPPHGLPTEEELKHFGAREETREEFESFSLYRDFLCCCLRMKTEERWSASALLKHPFLQKPISRHLRWMPLNNDASRVAKESA